MLRVALLSECSGCQVGIRDKVGELHPRRCSSFAPLTGREDVCTVPAIVKETSRSKLAGRLASAPAPEVMRAGCGMPYRAASCL